MKMFARFDENPAMTLQDIKETKRYGRMHARTDNMKIVYPPQTKFAGGKKIWTRWNIYCKILLLDALKRQTMRVNQYAGRFSMAIESLTLKAPPIICSRWQFKFCRFFKNNKWGMIFHENCLLQIIGYWERLRKMCHLLQLWLAL